jgi:hypothetical protein
MHGGAVEELSIQDLHNITLMIYFEEHFLGKRLPLMSNFFASMPQMEIAL